MNHGSLSGVEGAATQLRLLLAERRSRLLALLSGKSEEYRRGFLDGFATGRAIVAGFDETGHDGDFADGQRFERERIAARINTDAAELVEGVGVVPFVHKEIAEWSEMSDQQKDAWLASARAVMP